MASFAVWATRERNLVQTGAADPSPKETGYPPCTETRRYRNPAMSSGAPAALPALPQSIRAARFSPNGAPNLLAPANRAKHRFRFRHGRVRRSGKPTPPEVRADRVVSAPEDRIVRQLDRPEIDQGDRSACRSQTRRARETTNAPRDPTRSASASECRGSPHRAGCRSARRSRRETPSRLRSRSLIFAPSLPRSSPTSEQQADARFAAPTGSGWRRRLRRRCPWRRTRRGLEHPIALDAARKEGRHAIEMCREDNRRPAGRGQNIEAGAIGQASSATENCRSRRCRAR